ncbi:hypothetical protein Poli38472_009695 [Pythium oligandrum]|uniref:Cation-transporting ATPase n=1 Tax=Pythium oligandrum TaxID=41045 RepID=A0A8K1CHF9_PYTOL|nr:hypothetical protein Poli38472_009695 [Pythium oligandrum]|eukprot:TMW62202.1 hypothetical protein Poli38472_009695 [Pythium oligandrum]
MPVRVHIEDAEIAALALYVPLPWLLRLDVLPFLVLYTSAAYLAAVRPPEDVVVVLYFTLCIFFHALAFLFGEWSVDISAWMGFVPLRRWDAQNAKANLHVKVIPSRANLPRLLCRLQVPTTTKSAQEKSEKNDVPVLSFSYQNLSFCMYDDLKALNAGTARFRRLDYPTQHALSSYLEARGFQSADELEHARLKWGPNDFEIPVPLFSVLLKEQLVAPFFVFQFFCMLLWCLDEYVYYSLMTLVMLVIFECTVVKQRQNNMQILNGMRRPPQQIFVYRQRKWLEVWSDRLVPGDICSIGQKVAGPIAVKEDEKLRTVPCDLLILRGNAVVNESMLSGESIPLRKEALALDSQQDRQDMLCVEEGTSLEHKKHVLFGGTKILQHTLDADQRGVIPNAPDKGCIAYVLRTGFGTTQGSLMRTILHSSQRVTANNREAMWFITLLLVFAVGAAGFVLQHGLEDPLRNRFKLLLHCIMIITSVVPPELPMELSLAVTNSLLALTKFNIFCTEPFRIPFAGRIDVCCFDKTGTLTSDELKMLGVTGLVLTKDKDREAHASEMDLVSSEHLPLDTELVLAGCQSLVFLNGQVMGDPLEVTALQNVKWSVRFGYANHAARGESSVEPGIFSARRGVIQSVDILHRFSFSSELKRMSTVVSIVKSDNDEADEVRVLTKGAPEVLEPLFAEKPAFYGSVYRHFAAKGCRVLALGYRVLPTDYEAEKLVHSSSRRELESKLIFAGFLVLDCPLKEDSKRVLRDLLRSRHQVMVVTGDNALTACDVARRVGIQTATSALLLQPARTELGVEWTHIVNGAQDADELKPMAFAPAQTGALRPQYDLCVTGNALTALLKHQEQLHSGDETRAVEAYMRILEQVCGEVTVFARTSPVQKEHVIMALNRAGKTTAMCGDGTNDVGALKRAHVGVSIVNNPEAENSQRTLASEFGSQSQLQRKLRAIQEEEERSSVVQLGDASIASPFTSKSSSIRVMKQLVRQGRCTLVTTIQMYKILGINCLITAYSLSALFVHGVKNGDQQLTIVGLCIAMFFLFLSRAKPAKRLSKERPPPSVFCAPILVSILGQSFIHLAFLIGGLRIAAPFIDPSDPSMHPDGPFRPNVVNSIMFLLSVVMQVNTFVTNYKGEPFMESLWANKLLSRSALLMYGVLFLAVFEVFPPLNASLEMVPLPDTEVQWAVFALMAADTAVVLLLERVIGQLTAGSY